MTPVLRTDRLFLRTVGEPDVAALTSHWNDPLVRHHLWDDATVSGETVAAIVAAGLRWMDGDDGGDVELVYSLAPSELGSRPRHGGRGGRAGVRLRDAGADVCLAAPERVWVLGVRRRAGQLGLFRLVSPGLGRRRRGGGRWRP